MARIRKSLNLDAIGTLHGVETTINGERGTWIVDGQHRLQALLAEDMGDWLVDVVIHDDVKTTSEAAQLFLRLNARSVVSAYDTYLNELRALDPSALGIQHLAESFGLRVGMTPAASTLSCVTSLRRSFALDGGRSLRKALEIICDAWPGNSIGLEGRIVLGLSMLLHRHDNLIDTRNLKHRLSKEQPGDILARSRLLANANRRTVILEVVDAFARIYNLKRTTQAIPIGSKA